MLEIQISKCLMVSEESKIEWIRLLQLSQASGMSNRNDLPSTFLSKSVYHHSYSVEFRVSPSMVIDDE